MSTVNNNKSPPLFSILIACLGGILVGFSGIFVRASDLGPMTTGFYRLLFALPLMYVWMVCEREKNTDKKQTLTRNDYLTIVLAGLLFAVDLAFWNWSIDYTVIVNATLLNNTSAFFVPLFMWIIFSEKITLRTNVAAIFGFSGCMLLVGESFTISMSNLIGDVIALFTGLMVTAYVIAVKKIRGHLPTGFLMFWTGVVTLIGMGIFSVLFNESFWPLTKNDWISVSGLAIFVHLMGQGFLAYSLGKISASYGALILLLAPVTAAIFGSAIFGEHLSFIKLIGISIIMISIVAVANSEH
ncbi:MAG: DMT family transporter [Bacillota bacterium]|nr:DMT family transporter [Bacillota bacterium]